MPEEKSAYKRRKSVELVGLNKEQYHRMVVLMNQQLGFPSQLGLQGWDRKSHAEALDLTLERAYLLEVGEENSEMAKKNAAPVEEPKKAAKAAKAAAEPKKAAKAAAEPKPEGRKVGRLVKFKPEQKIKMLVDKNPKREGTKAHDKWEIYRNGMTVSEYLEKGGKSHTLSWDVNHDLISVS